MNKCQHVTKDKCETDQQESKSFNSVTTEQRHSSQLIINADGVKITAKFVISFVYTYKHFLKLLGLSDGTLHTFSHFIICWNWLQKK